MKKKKLLKSILAEQEANMDCIIDSLRDDINSAFYDLREFISEAMRGILAELKEDVIAKISKHDDILVEDIKNEIKETLQKTV